MKTVALVLVLAAAFPATSQAGPVTMVTRDVPLAARTLEAVTPPIRFNMLGLHWQGPGTVLYRTRSTTGRWLPWATADADSGPDSGPNRGLNARPAQRVPPWRDGNLVWTSASNGVQYRTTGVVTRLRAYYLWSQVGRRPLRTLSVAGSPAIVPRADWQADEKIVSVRPRYAPALKLAIVHHTAGTNHYTAAQAPAIVRGIELYHVEANGWNDIGYNFLIDRFGTVYEGRGGGVDRNVIGAHSEGFNAGSTGIALIGSFSRAAPPPAMRAALVRLLAWRLDVAHLDPLSTLDYRSGGNMEFKAGTIVSLHAISGHRDTGPTDCPGNGASTLLSSIAARVAATGLPKLYAPAATSTGGGDVRFRAQLSRTLAWTVTVANASGTVVASRSGTSAAIDWTWSPPAAAGPGRFTWAIRAPGVLPAGGKLRAEVAPAPAPPASPRMPPGPLPAPAPDRPDPLLPSVVVFPRVLNPAPDGTGSTLGAGFALGAPAFVTAQVLNGPVPVLSLLAAELPSGQSSFQWSIAALPNGRYTLSVTARASSGVPVTQSAPFVVDRTLSALTVGTGIFSPNGDGFADTLTLGFTLGQPTPVQVTIQRAGVQVATVLAAQLGSGPQTISWDGTGGGARLPDGAYAAVVTATDAYGTVSLLAPFAIDTTPPSLTVVGGASLRFQLNEAATVTATVNGQTTVVSEPAGVFAIPSAGGPVSSFTLQATDAAGNVSSPLTGP